jgi:hypothetical protein
MNNVYGALKISNGVNHEILEKLKLKRKEIAEREAEREDKKLFGE